MLKKITVIVECELIFTVDDGLEVDEKELLKSISLNCRGDFEYGCHGVTLSPIELMNKYIKTKPFEITSNTD